MAVLVLPVDERPPDCQGGPGNRPTLTAGGCNIGFGVAPSSSRQKSANVFFPQWQNGVGPLWWGLVGSDGCLYETVQGALHQSVLSCNISALIYIN